MVENNLQSGEMQKQKRYCPVQIRFSWIWCPLSKLIEILLLYGDFHVKRKEKALRINHRISITEYPETRIQDQSLMAMILNAAYQNDLKILCNCTVKCIAAWVFFVSPRRRILDRTSIPDTSWYAISKCGPGVIVGCCHIWLGTYIFHNCSFSNPFFKYSVP